MCTYEEEAGEEKEDGGAYTPIVTENDWKVFLRRVNAVYTNGYVGRDTRLASPPSTKAIGVCYWSYSIASGHRTRGEAADRECQQQQPAAAAAAAARLSLDDKHPHFARELEFLLKPSDRARLHVRGVSSVPRALIHSPLRDQVSNKNTER